MISRRKTIRAVIMRIIIDGTTDMRESPDWIVSRWRRRIWPGRYRAFAEPIVLLILNPRQQRDPCRARDVGLGISSKLRRHRAPHIMNSWCDARHKRLSVTEPDETHGDERHRAIENLRANTRLQTCSNRRRCPASRPSARNGSLSAGRETKIPRSANKSSTSRKHSVNRM